MFLELTTHDFSLAMLFKFSHRNRLMCLDFLGINFNFIVEIGEKNQTFLLIQVLDLLFHFDMLIFFIFF